jgi:glycosyltransferase involved in cell wall biosynthesis
MRAALVSFRLGGADGVSVEAAKWTAALRRLGWTVRTVAGAGRADLLLPGLDLDAPDPPSATDLARALDGADVVLVENVLSLPRNPAAAELLADLLCGRPALLHHHDLAWQRDTDFPVTVWPPDDPAWRHIAINELSRQQLADRGVPSVTIYNTLEAGVRRGRRLRTRRRLRVPHGVPLVLQPTRAIARKNVPAGIAVAERLGGVYWLTGPAEDGYAEELAGLLRAARCPVIRRIPSGLSISDAYAAADVVAFPSTWEGFGNPVLEAAIHRRPLVVADYPVLRELRQFGFIWFSVDDPAPLQAFLAYPDRTLHDKNADIARTYFAPATLDARLDLLLRDVLAGPRGAARTVPLSTSDALAAADPLSTVDGLDDLDGVADPV